MHRLRLATLVGHRLLCAKVEELFLRSRNAECGECGHNFEVGPNHITTDYVWESRMRFFHSPLHKAAPDLWVSNRFVPRLRVLPLTLARGS